jgi:hypothetical protein
MTAQPPQGFVGSTFRTKGLVYLGAIEFWDKVVPGGTEAVGRALVDAGHPEVAALIETHFIPGAWYPVFPIVTCAVAAARLRSMQVGPHIRENAAWIARRDLRGVYRMILSVASVDAVAKRLGPLSMRYFDFGASETREVRPGVVESDRIGIPAALASWFVWCAEGFVPVALTMAGAKTVDVRSAAPVPEGERSGIKTVRIRFEISWT